MAAQSRVNVESMSRHEILGSGILVGVDRILVPLHVVGNAPATQLNLSFGEKKCHIYSGQEYVEHNSEKDFCIIRVNALDGVYPEKNCLIPEVSDTYFGEVMLAHQVNGETVFSFGETCSQRDPNESSFMSSHVKTYQGSSGAAITRLMGRSWECT